MIAEASAKARASASAGVSPRLARRAPHFAAASRPPAPPLRSLQPRIAPPLPSAPSPPAFHLPLLQHRTWCPTAAAFPAQVRPGGRYSTPRPLRVAFLQLHPHWSFSSAFGGSFTSGAAGSPSCSNGEPFAALEPFGGTRRCRAELGVEG